MKIRLAGVLLLCICAFAAWSLHRLAIVPPLHRATAPELLCAALAFLCGSVGAVMAALGRGLFAPVPAPPRPWRFSLRNDH